MRSGQIICGLKYTWAVLYYNTPPCEDVLANFTRTARVLQQHIQLLARNIHDLIAETEQYRWSKWFSEEIRVVVAGGHEWDNNAPFLY